MEKQQLAIGAILVIAIISLAMIFPMAAQPSHSGNSAATGLATRIEYAKMLADDGNTATVQIMAAGKTLTYNVEVASTPEEISRGLKYRTRLAPDAGMLFVFDSDDNRFFWMKNTLIPLDMVYISSGGRVVGVRENAVPRSMRLIPPPGPCRYVLEVGGGQCRRQGVCAGDPVAISLA
jgi:uncharacterized protein